MAREGQQSIVSHRPNAPHHARCSARPRIPCVFNFIQPFSSPSSNILNIVHYQGIIHRDIKPANLLYTFDRSHVKIGDFGVSHFSYAQRLSAIGAAGGDPASQDKMDPILLDDSALTMRAGTPMFIAPEVVWEYRIPTTTSSPSLARGQPLSQLPRSASIPDRSSVGGSSASPLSLRDGADSTSPISGSNSPSSSSSGRPPVTKAIDVWALGITFFCLLTGTLPYEASANEWALFGKIANQNVTLPADLGVDRVPVTGRREIDHDWEKGRVWRKSEGKQKLNEGNLIHELLEGLLQRDPANRITLDELKVRILHLHIAAQPNRSLIYVLVFPIYLSRRSRARRLALFYIPDRSHFG